MKLIVAVNAQNSIGLTTGQLPWRNPKDMKRFKELTTNKVVVMGLNTFVSLNRHDGLPNRTNIVLSSKVNYAFRAIVQSDNVNHFKSFDKLPNDCWIIGGAKVYKYAIEQGYIDEIYLSLIHFHEDDESLEYVKFPHNIADYSDFAEKFNFNVDSCEIDEINGVTFIKMNKTII
jgi:dihydrofolate reductase